MIRTFREREAERLYQRQRPRRLPASILRVAQRKLEMLDAAETLSDLRLPPGNRLEKLSGDRAGQHSIGINDQWRLCFVWKDGDAYEVEITDHH